MVAFGRALGKIWAEVETPDPTLTNNIKANLDNLTRRYGDKGKKLTEGFSSLRLNASSFAQLEAKALELKIPKSDRNRIQEDLSRSRVKAISKPAKKNKLVTALTEKLAPLLAALKAEKSRPIPKYDEAVAR
jgi:hypothetical protein